MKIITFLRNKNTFYIRKKNQLDIRFKQILSQIIDLLVHPILSVKRDLSLQNDQNELRENQMRIIKQRNQEHKTKSTVRAIFTHLIKFSIKQKQI